MLGRRRLGRVVREDYGSVSFRGRATRQKVHGRVFHPGDGVKEVQGEGPNL